MVRIFIQNFIECVYGFFVPFAFNQVKASLKGFIVSDNNSSGPFFRVIPAGSFECYVNVFLFSAYLFFLGVFTRVNRALMYIDRLTLIKC